MSFEDCARKFRECAGWLPGGTVETIIEMTARLETLDDAADVIRLMA
jgi:hypothetical protein